MRHSMQALLSSTTALLVKIQAMITRHGLPSRLWTALCIIAGATGLRVLMQPVLGTRLTYLTFYPAVALAALLTGFGPGVLATLLAGAIVAAWHEPLGLGAALINDSADGLGLLVFLVSGLLLAALGEALQQARGQAMALDAQMKLMDERSRSDQALKAYQDHTRYILKYTPNSVAVLDRNLCYLMVSDRFLDNYHLSEKEIIGKSHYTVFPEIDERWRQVHQRCLTGAVEQGEEESFPREDGTTDFVSWECRPWYESDGRVGGIILYTEVITERKKIEQTLRERERQMTTLLANLPGAAYRCKNQPQWPMEFISAGVEDLTGYPAAAFISDQVQLADIIISEDVPRVWEAVQDGLAQHRPFQMEYRVRHADGTIHWLWEQGQGVWNSAGELQALEGFITDITRRRQTEEETRQNEEKLRLALDGAQMGMWDWDLINDALTWSDRCKEIFGLPLDAEMTYDRFLNAVCPEDRSLIDRAVQQALEEKKDYQVEMRALWPDGSIHWIASMGRGYYNDQGRLMRMTGVAMEITERRRNEAQARRWQRVFDEAAFGLTYVDAKTNRLLEVNTAFARQRGYTPDELKGRSLLDVYPQESHERIKQLIRETDAAGHLVFEGTHQRKDGSRFPVMIEVTVIRDAQGHPVSRVAYALDITERKRIADELHQQREWLQVTLNSIGDGVITCDQQGRITFINPVAQSLTGWSQEASAGEAISRVFNIINEQTGQAAPNLIEQVFRDKCIIDLANHTALVNRDGRVIPIEDSVAPIQDSTGQINGAVLVFHDVTQRRRAQNELRESEKRFRTMINAISQLAWIAGPDGEVIWFNQRWHDYTGLSFEETAGLGWQKTHHPDTLPQVFEEWRQSLKTGEVFDMTYPLRGADGQYRLFLTRAIPVRDETGQIVQWFGTNTDITEQKQAEDALREANRRLAEADRRKNEFLAMLAHELRNPLAPVRNAIQIMHIIGPKDPAITRQQDIIDRQVTHMAHLINDLLDVSRITRGMVELKKRRVDLAAVIAQAVELTTPLIETRHHQLSIKMPDVPIYLEADPDRLAQIIGNLLNNAAKYTPENGQLWLEAQRAGDTAVICVRDNGTGISAEMMPSIFDLFTQADQGLARSQGGLGIGLTMVKSLVELHGGSIEAHSQGLNQGSEFIVRLPAPVEPCTEAGASAVSEAGGAHKIMVVDGSVDSTESLASILKMWGYEVRTAPNGPMAVTLAQDFQPEFILLDTAMPSIDGIEVARRLRQVSGRRPMRLIAMSEHPQEPVPNKARPAGFDDYLEKPVDLDSLRSILTHSSR